MKRRWISVTVVVAMACLLNVVGWPASGAAAQDEYGPPKDWKKNYRGKYLDCPQPTIINYARDRYGKDWNFDDGTLQGVNFSENVRDLKVEDGKLRFTTISSKCAFGWGDRYGDKPKNCTEDIRMMPNSTAEGGGFAVKVRARQSAEKSTWSVLLLEEGKVVRTTNRPVELAGKDWKDLIFRCSPLWHADSIIFGIQGPDGNQVEVDSVEIVMDRRQAYYRKVVELPDKPIYRAVANVGAACDVWLNGKHVYSVAKTLVWWNLMYTTVPVDLKPYLRPGKNIFCIYGERAGYPRFSYIDTEIHFVDGTTVTVISDETWKFSPTAKKGWTALDYPAADWQQVTTRDLGGLAAAALPLSTSKAVLVNPYPDLRLFYEEEKDVRLQVQLPAGYAEKRLNLKAEVIDTAAEESIGAQETAKFQADKRAITYQVNFGRLRQGVYRFKVHFEGTDENLSRDEFFIVFGKIQQPEVEGNSFTEGMDLTLLDTIDLTDPNDPHPMIFGGFGETRIVKKDGMEYREVGPNRSGGGRTSFVSYKVKFLKESLYRAHLLEFDYPDNDDRGIAVNLARSHIGVFTGWKYPNTMKMQTKRMFFYPTKEEDTLDFVNQGAGNYAAISKIRIYRMGQWPAVKMRPSGERWFGVMSERGPTMIYQIAVGPERDYLQKEAMSSGGYIKAFYRGWFDTLCEFVRYLKFSGQNMHMCGVYQYHQMNTGMCPLWQVKDSTLTGEFREIMAKMFEVNDIMFIANVEYVKQNGGFLFHSPTDGEMVKGADTVWGVSKDGKQASPSSVLDYGGFNANIVHPEAEDELLTLTRNIAQWFAPYRSFKGIVYQIFPGFFSPGLGMDLNRKPLDWGYDDTSMRTFEKDTGLEVPGDSPDPARFQKRYDWIMKNAKDRFIRWRSEKIRDFMILARDAVRSVRKDLFIMGNLYLNTTHMKDAVTSSKDARTFLAEYGYDPTMYRGLDGVIWGAYVMWTWRYDHLMGGDIYSFCWDYNRDPEVVKLYDMLDPRVTFGLIHFDENGYKFKEKTDWPHQGGFIAPNVLPSGSYASECLAHVLIDTDPTYFPFGWCDWMIMVGGEQNLRQFARVFLALPGGKFTRLTGPNFDDNVVFKTLAKDGDLYAYLVNPGFWKCRVSIEFEGKGQVIDLATGERLECRRKGQHTILSFELGPYGVRAFRVPGGGLVPAGTQARAANKKKERLLTGRLKRFQGYASNPRARLILDQPEAMTEELDRVGSMIRQGRYTVVGETLLSGRMHRIMEQKLARPANILPWLVIGPFENDRHGKGLKTVWGPEKEVLASGRPDLAKTYVGMDADRNPAPVKWKRALTTTFRSHQRFLSFLDAFYNLEWAVAYAFTYIYSPKARDVTFVTGSDDAIAVWVNGKQVYLYPEQRGAQPDQDRFPVHLKQGWNPLLVKVDNWLGGWGFLLNIVEESGQSILGQVVISPDSNVKISPGMIRG